MSDKMTRNSFDFFKPSTWLFNHNKEPKLTESGLWRWTCPDLPSGTRSDELPQVIFDNLRYFNSDNTKAPWLFNSRDTAFWAAARAIGKATKEGQFSLR
jgi:hypothetical protein